MAPRARRNLRDLTGRILRTWREECELTREQLAPLIGKSVSTITRWERGVAEPRVSDLRSMEERRPGLIEALF
jgi:transcriptional regulator with XRE-family HTH domain